MPTCQDCGTVIQKGRLCRQCDLDRYYAGVLDTEMQKLNDQEEDDSDE